MKKIALALSFTLVSGFSTSLETIVDNALKNNYDLKSIEKSISIANENIKLSTKWKNPTLTFGVNDIHFDEPTSRDKEPMQAQYIGFSQVIPTGNKLSIKEDIAKKDKRIVSLNLEDKKLKLKAKVYEASYNILVLEKKLELLNSYEKNIRKLEKLSTSLYKYGKSSQNEILNAKISYSNIQIQKQNLKNTIDNLYLKLEQITYTKIDLIKSNLDMKKLVLNMNIESHPRIQLEEEKAKKFNDIAKLEIENEKSDIKLNVAYFNRDDKYKDYANISVNIPLSLYKTEKVKSIKAKIEASRVNDRLVDLKQGFKTELTILQNNMNNTLSNYKLIEKNIIPIKKKIQKNIENYNSFSQIKPQMAIQNLNELISFEIKAYEQMKEYFSFLSKSKYYMTEVK